MKFQKIKLIAQRSCFLLFATLVSHASFSQCAVPVATISENFAGGVIPTCWTTDYTFGYANVYISGQAVHMTTDNNNFTVALAHVVTPLLTNAHGNLTFYAERGFGFSVSPIEVGVVSSPTNLGSFTLIQTFTPPVTTGGTYSVNLSSYTGNYKYICFRVTESPSGNRKVILDNINYTAACESSTVTAITQNLTVQLNSQGTATISPSQVNNGSTAECAAPALSLDLTQFTCANIGTNTVTLTATDNSGNTSTATAVVTVLAPINDVAVTANPTSLCSSGSSTVSIPSSVAGINYYLRDDANNAIIAGPVLGTGGALSFNTGTISSTTTYNVYGETVSSISNTALTFDGTNDFVNMPCEGSFNYGAGFTYEAWINAPNPGTPSRAIFFSGTNTMSDIEVYHQSGSNRITVVYNRNHSGGVTVSGGVFTVPPVSTWYHLAVTYDGTTTKVYFNGIEQAMFQPVNGSPLEKSPTAELALGYIKSSATNPGWGFGTFLGQMDEVRIWNSARSITEINNNKDACLSGPQVGLVDYYKLNDATGGIAIDAAGTSNGTLTNMTPNANWVAGQIMCTAPPSDPACYREMSQLVTVTVGVDNVAPVPNNGSLAPLTAQCSIASLTAPMATDNCIGSVMGTHNATLPLTASTSILWTYDDGNGNTSTQTQSVVINDNTAPVADIASLPNVTAQCSVSSLAAPTATDNCSGALTGTHNATFPITANTTVTWTYDDGNGNITTQAQNVVLSDNTAPVADVASLATLTDECSISSLTAPVATDNCDGTITGTHNVTLPITSSMNITWTYLDASGNSSTQTQAVVINDVTAPVVDNPTLLDIEEECFVSSLIAPTATDNCAGTIIGTHTETFPIMSSTTITWSFDDGKGNITTQTQNLVLNDVTAPVPNVANLADVISECEVNSLVAPTALDACMGTTTGTHNATFPIAVNSTVTWTYNDGNGNISTQDQFVIIDDVTAPVPNSGTLAEIVSYCAVQTVVDPLATDNCNGSIWGTTTTTFPITASTTIVWTFDDGNGNTATQNQIVTINAIDLTVSVLDVTITANQSGATYQWVDCSNGNAAISGETNATFTASTNGTYAVEITIGNCTETTACTTISGIGIAENEIIYANVYPNPTRDLLNIATEDQIKTIQVLDLTGKVIQIEQEPQFSTQNLANGTYLLRIETTKGVAMKPFVKQ